MPQLRLARLAGAAAVLVVIAPLCVGGAATAANSRRPSAPNPHAKVAEQALAAVQAAFSQSPRSGASARGSAPAQNGEITLALRDLHANLGALSDADRRAAEAYLARPTDSSEFFGAAYGRASNPTSDCKMRPNSAAVQNSHFCIHYARSGNDAPPPADKHPHNGIPDQVDKTRTVMNHVWDAIVTQGGYHAPPSDGGVGGRVNGQWRFDVYLSDIGDQGLYGYCSPETAVATAFSTHAATSYCVLDDDYREFPNHTHLQNLEVTGAHEFFHSVQFAYDYTDDTFFLENTATWVEDQIYSDINDNRQFLVDSSKNNPGRPLDANAARYGNWIWWRYLTEQFPDAGSSDLPLLVRHTWENAISTYSVQALSQTLAGLGTTIPEQLSGFGVASRDPSDGFSEGNAYSAAPPYTTPIAFPSNAVTRSGTVTLKHLANGTVVFTPNSGYTSGWHLDVSVGGPASADDLAVATVYFKDGTTDEHAVPVNGGSVRVSFDDTVQRVDLTLTNGGHDYSCNHGTNWACSGNPLDDGVSFSYSASSSNA